jgi:hypothetical protein
MALPPLASVTDLEARLVAPITDAHQRERAEALLADASTLVRYEANRTWVDPDTGLPTAVPDVAVTICLQAALRAFYNPAQVASQQLGAASVRYGDVWLTGSECERLAGLGRTRGELQSIELQPGFGFERDYWGYAPVDNEPGMSTPAADWFPIGY